MIAAPPVELGAVKAIAADPLAGVADRDVGASEAIAAKLRYLE